MKRRTFLLAGLGTGGALLFGWALLPPRQRLTGSTLPSVDDGRVALNGWVTIAPDERVTVIMAKAEMGQGIHTAAAMLLAEELECDWANVSVAHGPVDAIYNNLALVADGLGFHPDDSSRVRRSADWIGSKLMREVGLMMTGASTSVRDLWDPMRDAGAAARATLVDAAATRWRVNASECAVQAGVVTHGDKRVSYGELVGDGMLNNVSPPRGWSRKDPSRFTLLGKSTRRLEAASKSNGTAQFGLDVRLPGMLYAAVQMAPTFGARVRTVAREKAIASPGVRGVVPFDGSHGSPAGVAVVAESWIQARRGAAQLDITWDLGANSALSSRALIASLAQTAHSAADNGGGTTFRAVGDVDASLADSDQVIDATYTVPWLAHTTMEPMNCTVHRHQNGADVWVGTQVPGLARAAAARVLGLDDEQVRVHVTLLGGGFGRRLDTDFIAQAAEIAASFPGTPVQLIWTREQDVRHDMFRPACAARLSVGVDASGAITAFRAVSAGQSIAQVYGERTKALGVGLGPDKTTAEGAFDQPYNFSAMRAAHDVVEVPIPVGYWRAVGHSHHAFFVESMLDEVAHATGQDPVALRASLLAHHPRALAVLRLAAERSGWGTEPANAPDGARVARGVALHRSFGAIVAQVADVSLGEGGSIRVHRVTCAVDCGFAVNPAGVAQQIESAVVYGLSAALYGEITVENGAVVQGNFDSYRAIRIGECPVIETHIVPSAERPEGMGEPGLPPVAPAVANAVFALTGERLRSLPLRVKAPAPEGAA